MDAAVPDADAAEPEIDSGLDPDVVFEWTQTLPGGDGTCTANVYVGSFSCTLEDRQVAPLVGQITLEVAASGEGESTLLVTGKLVDPTGTGVLFSADINGQLDCTAKELDAGAVSEVAMGFFGDTMFTASLNGVYDGAALEILGEIVIVNQAEEVCRGSFQVGASL